MVLFAILVLQCCEPTENKFTFSQCITRRTDDGRAVHAVHGQDEGVRKNEGKQHGVESAKTSGRTKGIEKTTRTNLHYKVRFSPTRLVKARSFRELYTRIFQNTQWVVPWHARVLRLQKHAMHQALQLRSLTQIQDSSYFIHPVLIPHQPQLKLWDPSGPTLTHVWQSEVAHAHMGEFRGKKQIYYIIIYIKLHTIQVPVSLLHGHKHLRNWIILTQSKECTVSLLPQNWIRVDLDDISGTRMNCSVDSCKPVKRKESRPIPWYTLWLPPSFTTPIGMKFKNDNLARR